MSETRRFSLGSLAQLLAVSLAAAVAPLYAWKVWIKTDYTDFLVYYRAGERWLAQDWGLIYSLNDGTSPLRYAPPFLPWFGLLAHLPRQPAQLLWYGLQYFTFAGGFYLLYRCLLLTQGTSPNRASLARSTTALSFLFTLRLILDAFTIGQVSGWMFLAWTAGLWGFLHRRPWILALGACIPAWLKVGPGILIVLLLGVRDARRGLRQTLVSVLSWTFGFAALFWIAGQSFHTELWRGWLHMIAKDSDYYDAAHYGSQSLKSFLLRTAKQGALTPDTANQLYLILAVGTVLGLIVFWALRHPRSARGRVFFFSQALIAVMLLMPETFKYSLIPLAIPLGVLFQTRKHPLAMLSVLFWISLAGKDLLPDSLFFWLQLQSFPLLAVSLVFFAVCQEAWVDSAPSKLGQALLGPAPEVWSTPPALFQSIHKKNALILTLACTSDSRLSVFHLRRALKHTQIDQLARSGVHIVLVPFGKRADRRNPRVEACLEQLSAEVLWLPNALHLTAAQALRLAILKTPHHFGVYLSADQLPSFRELKTAFENPDSITVWSRRHPHARLIFNGSSLRSANGRYHLGGRLQKLLAWKFAELRQTTDLQSDAIAGLRNRWLKVLSLSQLNQGLWQTEFRLNAQNLGFSVQEKPAVFLIADEKSGSIVLRESLSILRSLRYLWATYKQPRLPQQLAPLPGLTADDWGLSRGVNTAMLDLIAQGTLKRVSILAHGEALTDGLEQLLALERSGQVTLGLHYDLSYRRRQSPARVIWDWLRHKLTPEIAMDALREQLQILHTHRVPVRYLDGHHHLHLLPGLLEKLGPLLQEAGIKNVRIALERRFRWTGSRILIWLLARSANRKTSQIGLQANAESFLYPSWEQIRSRSQLFALLAQAQNAEILFHPAAWNDLNELKIPEPHYQNERLTEYGHLSLVPFWREPS